MAAMKELYSFIAESIGSASDIAIMDAYNADPDGWVVRWRTDCGCAACRTALERMEPCQK